MPGRDPIQPFSQDICSHMNEDHADALLVLARSRGRLAAAARMVGVDARGFEVELSGAKGSERLRFEFGEPQETPGGVKDRLVEMIRSARAASRA